MKYRYSVNGVTYTLPANEVEAFLKQYPNAQLIETIDDAAGKQLGVATTAASATPETVAVDTESKLAKSSLDSPGAIVDALGGFLSTATDMVADFQTMPSMGLLALKGLVDKDFGPEEKQKVLEELSDIAYLGPTGMPNFAAIPKTFQALAGKDVSRDLFSSNTLYDAADLVRDNFTKDYEEKYGYTHISQAFENARNKNAAGDEEGAKKDYDIAAEMAVSGFFASAPYTIAAMFGPYGLAFMGGSVAGGKFKQEIEQGNDAPLASVVTNAALTGGVEALFDRYTAGLFRQAKQFVRPSDLIQAKKVLKDGLQPLITKLAKGSARTVVGAGGEGVTEGLTELTNAYVDELTFDREVKWEDIKYNIFDAGILGAITGGGIKAVSEIGGTSNYARQRAEEILMPEKSKKEINQATAKVIQNLNLLKNPNISETQENLLIKQNNLLAEDTYRINKENTIKLGALNQSELNDFVSNKQRQLEIKELAKTPGVQESTIKALKEEHTALENVNTTITNKAVERKADERIKKFDKTLQDVKGITSYLGVKIKRFTSEEEYNKYKSSKPKEKQVADNAIGYYDSKEKEIVVKDYKIQNKQGMGRLYASTVPTHEIMHAVIGKIIQDKNLRTTLGRELISHVTEMGSGYFINKNSRGAITMRPYMELAKEMKQDLGAVIDMDNISPERRAALREGANDIALAELADEGISRTSDALFYGLIDENNSVLDKFTDFFRRASQEIIGVPIEFNTRKDTYNFIKDFNNDLERGRMSAAMRKTLKEGAKGKILTTTKTEDNISALEKFIGPEFKFFADNSTADDIRAEFKKLKKGWNKLNDNQKAGGAMVLAQMFKGVVAKKLQSHDWRPDFNQFKDIILDDFLIDEGQGITQLIVRHLNTNSGGTIDGFVNDYFPDRLHKYVNNYLQPIKKDEEGIPVNAEFMQMLKRDAEKVSPDPSEIKEQLETDKVAYKVNTIDNFNLPGELAVTAQEISRRAIILNIEDINKQAGKTFRGILSQEARREFSNNLSALDIALKGNRGAERYKNFEKWLLKEKTFEIDGKTIKKKNIQLLYEMMDVEDFAQMKKAGAPFITKLTKADGSVHRTYTNYAGYQSYAGNQSARKKSYTEVQKLWNDFLITGENKKGSSEFRNITETNYRRIRDVFADKIAADQLNFLVKNDVKFRELLNIKGIELTDKVIDQLKRNLRQGAFGIKQAKDVEEHFEDNPATIYDILNKTVEIENYINVDKMNLGTAVAQAYPHLPEDIAVDLESSLTKFHLKEARDFDEENTKVALDKMKKQSPSKRVSDMLDGLSGKSKVIKSAKYRDLAARLGEKQSWYKRIFKGDFFVPYNAEDFEGLLYNFYRKGKLGEEDQKFFEENILKSYFAGTEAIDTERLQVSGKLKDLVKRFENIPGVSLETKIDSKGLYSIEDAIRIWNFLKVNTKAKVEEVTGLSQEQISTFENYVDNKPEILRFAKQVQLAAGLDGYPPVNKGWRGGNIRYDLIEVLNTSRRTRYLQDWSDRMATTFTPKVMAKMEAEFGSVFVKSFEDTIERMRSGRSTASYGNSVMDKFLDYVNKSQGAIMFLNARSATLQLISATNFINYSDNNILAAAEAFSNQEQYWSDVYKILTSDFLKARREGTTINIVEEDFIRSVNQAKNGPAKFRRAVGFLLDNGYVLTRAADSLAIATGGATFYRNRKNKLLKEGISEQEAEKVAFSDFRTTALKAQQSSDQALISNIQASQTGRFMYAFANTPFQYNRLMKKAYRNLVDGRGDWKENTGKIIYYGGIQNLIFNGLQSAALAALSEFRDDDDDEKKQKLQETKLNRITNGMASSILRGSGPYGLTVDVARSIINEVNKEAKKAEIFQDQGDAVLRGLLDISPPLDHKYRKLRKATEPIKYDEGFGFQGRFESPFSPKVEAIANGAELFNIPASRVLQKIENMNNLFYSTEISNMGRLALFAGWSDWDLGIEKTQGLLGGELYNKRKIKPKKRKM